MSDKLSVGAASQRTVAVDKDRTIGFMGEDCRVYATPALVADIENTCRDMILALLPEGQDSVGAVVSIAHMAPTVLGMEATITATVSALEGRKVVFDVEAHDQLDEICKGRHERFIVDVDRTRDRLRQKSARLKGA